MPRIPACTKHRKLILRMVHEDASIKQIARTVHTNERHVRAFLLRLGIRKHFPKTRPGERNPKWRGGQSMHKRGYLMIYCPDHPRPTKVHGIYVFEHHLVAEEMLGRYLRPGEVVHHKNKDKTDNRPENLQVFATNGEHLAMELKGKTPKWTRDGLARMRAGVLRSAAKRRKRNRQRSRQHALPLR